MTRILLVETASPKRVASKLKQILDSAASPKPEISILCRESSRPAFPDQPGLTIYTVADHGRRRPLEELNNKKFDVLYAFWTGERQYRGMKLLALRVKAVERHLIAGDGNEFRLTWKAMGRHAIFRARHPLPTDHWDFILPPPVPVIHKTKPPAQPAPVAKPEAVFQGERILILQSAEPPYVLQALDRLAEYPLFRNPRYTLFCRNRPGIVDQLKTHRLLYAVRIHSETRGSWRHLQELRKSRFDALILFLTGDPSYWKLKIFAFLLGVPWRRILIFNESIDCFFFNLHPWLRLIRHRMQSPQLAEADSKWTHSLRILVSLFLKSGMLPFRFLWLLLVWLRLRSAGLIASRR
jgi:hypothetical protein